MSILSRQPLVLGFVLNKFPRFNINMRLHEDRIRFQHFMYLLQSCGVSLGYDHTYFLNGPYDTRLVADGIVYDMIKHDYDSRKPDNTSRFANNTIQTRFENFRDFVYGYEMDSDYLKMASIIHMMRLMGQRRQEIIRVLVKCMGKQYDSIQIRSMSNQYLSTRQDLINFGMLSADDNDESYTNTEHDRDRMMFVEVVTDRRICEGNRVGRYNASNIVGYYKYIHQNCIWDKAVFTILEDIEITSKPIAIIPRLDNTYYTEKVYVDDFIMDEEIALKIMKKWREPEPL